MSYFGKSYHPPGTAPGTLDDRHRGEIEIRLVDFDDKEYVERMLDRAEDCRTYLDRVSRTWIQVNGRPDAETLRSLGRLFDLHELALEDVLNTGQRPKMDIFGDQMFLVLALPVHRNGSVVTEQISIFAGSDYVICFSTSRHDPFEPLRKRMRPPSTSRLRSMGIDYLLYAIIDLVVDAAFPVLEEFGSQIEELEEMLLASPSQDAIARIHHVRRELLLLRRMLWPQRELVSRLQRDEVSLISDAAMPFLRDCHDHCVQIIDLLESFREMSSSLLEVYLSSISNRTNEIMRVLTIIATIFIPLTFIVGVYGMNFDTSSPWGMPELGWYYGYPLIWAVIIAVAAGLLWFFRRKGWL
jgi:magnesium transporter